VGEGEERLVRLGGGRSGGDPVGRAAAGAWVRGGGERERQRNATAAGDGQIEIPRAWWLRVRWCRGACGVGGGLHRLGEHAGLFRVSQTAATYVYGVWCIVGVWWMVDGVRRMVYGV
jgi:hypothetical protein